MPRPNKVIPELCRNYILSSTRKTYTRRDTILYALGLGVSSDPLDVQDLRYTYENSDDFAALPSFVVVIPPIESVFEGLLSCPGIPDFNPMMLLHAEESIQFSKQIPTDATVECTSQISEVLDKGSGALVRIHCEIYDVTLSTDQSAAKKTSPLCLIDMSVFIRGIGGFQRHNSTTDKEKENREKKQISSPPQDLLIKRPTTANQAILYRLSGDTNPLHIDPNLSSMGGFNRPILHGLCTYGIAAHSIIKYLGKNSPSFLRSIEARFTSPVTPGDELDIRIWIESESEIRFDVNNSTTKKICVSDGKAKVNAPLQLPKSQNHSSL